MFLFSVEINLAWGGKIGSRKKPDRQHFKAGEKGSCHKWNIQCYNRDSS